MSAGSPLSILMVASEAVPFAKTGGLADVTTALSGALSGLGHEVTLVVPRYRGGAPEAELTDRTTLWLGGRAFDLGYEIRSLASGATVVLVVCDELYARPGLYADGGVDHADNAIRFAVLARAALHHGAHRLPRVDVVHAHDWQTGLVPVYLRAQDPAHPTLRAAATIFTVHNLGYQGTFDPSVLSPLELSPSLFTMEGLEYWGQVSFLKAGINFCDAVTTVSPTYAREILTPEHGYGMDGVMRARRDRLHGILNGIDTEVWNPAADPFLPAPYDASDLGGKREAKRRLLERFDLPASDVMLERPLVGMISRLVYQKGFDLMREAMDELPGLGATFVILGTGEQQYEDMWRHATARHPDAIRVRIGYDEELAHLIEAGADLFLMPSRYEPCGLNQMYSMRYGTVPVVRATGGLADAVVPGEHDGRHPTGFTFSEYTASALLAALRDAIAAFADRPRWRALQQAGMTTDFSWTVSAHAYVQLYRALVPATEHGGERSTHA